VSLELQDATQSTPAALSRFFVRFCFITQRTSGSSLRIHRSIRGRPASGAAATATLQQ
jgi:hypothetical protein